MNKIEIHKAICFLLKTKDVAYISKESLCIEVLKREQTINHLIKRLYFENPDEKTFSKLLESEKNSLQFSRLKEIEEKLKTTQKEKDIRIVVKKLLRKSKRILWIGWLVLQMVIKKKYLYSVQVKKSPLEAVILKLDILTPLQEYWY
ncbi:MAG: hypothetical protein A2V66_11855 [Ignavibacteria bacterium RBG_13_36_8]|nr:MAG: hypothetical protein A2V66_11855 [Ignavibacteria bacterium RBG_13_36_8]